MLLGALRVQNTLRRGWYWGSQAFRESLLAMIERPKGNRNYRSSLLGKSSLPACASPGRSPTRFVLRLRSWCSRSRRGASFARKIIYFEPHREQIGYRDERVRFLDVGCGDHLFWATARRLCRSAPGEEQVPLRVCQAEHHQGLQRARRLLSLRMDAQGHERPNAELSALSSRSLRQRFLRSYPRPRRSIAKRQRNRLSTINSSEPPRTPGSIVMRRDAH
jgi:hypothetical protein